MEPLIIEKIIHAPATRVWKAITEKDEMKRWYFDLADFKPEVGFGFQFYGGDDEKKYLHLCKVTEVIPGKKLTYSWQYETDPAITFVTFELFPEGDKTRLKLTHEGLEKFAKDNPDLDPKNFAEGWTMIIGTHLKEYLE